MVSIPVDFEWPAVSGTANGIIIWSALTDPEIANLYGNFDYATFGWE